MMVSDLHRREMRQQLFALAGVLMLVGMAAGPAAAGMHTGAQTVQDGAQTGDEADVGIGAFSLQDNETDDNETDDETTNDTDGNESDVPFGLIVSQFVQELQSMNETDGPIGITIASFVTENNPGNAPDHAGPPEDAGPGGDDNETDQGPPEDAGPGGNDDGDDDDADDEDDADEEEDEEDEDDADDDDDGGDASGNGGNGNGGGPPDDAGPP